MQFLQRGAGRAGLDRRGVQAEWADGLAGVRERFSSADHAGVVDETGVACRGARSDEHRVRDPQGIAWAVFHSLGSIPFHGEGGAPTRAVAADPKAVPHRAAGCG